MPSDYQTHASVAGRCARGGGSVLILLAVLCCVGDVRSQQPPPAKDAPVAKPAAAETSEQINDRDRLATESLKLRGEGKLSEAAAAAEKVLAIERRNFQGITRRSWPTA